MAGRGFIWTIFCLRLNRRQCFLGHMQHTSSCVTCLCMRSVQARYNTSLMGISIDINLTCYPLYRNVYWTAVGVVQGHFGVLGLRWTPTGPHLGGNHLISTLIKGEIRWFTPKTFILSPVFCWWRRWPCDWNKQSWGHLWPLQVIWRWNKGCSVVPCSSDVDSMWFLKLRFSASQRWGGILWMAGCHWGRN